jgi:ATP/maltotriose-dependent transcriptional regulator MalT
VAKIVNEEEDELRGKLDKFRAQYPDMPPVPTRSLEFTSWLGEVKQRFQADQMRRTAEEEWKLRKQINECGAEYLRYLEIRRKAKSEQELGEKRSKIESLRVEAELKKLEIENAQYDVELKKFQGKPNSTSQDGAPFEQKLKQLQRLGDEKEQALKKAKTEDERDLIESVYQDQRIRILEGRD